MVQEQVSGGSVEPSMLDPRVLDPDQELVSRTALTDRDVDQVVRLLEGLRRWREAEHRVSEASRRYMKLGETDMRALRFIITLSNQARLATPGAIATHLGISSASTTKLLDRLAESDHIRRLPHPSDRRSVTIEVTEETARVARETVGRSHAHRFDAAARLTSQEREIVTRFLDDLAATGEHL
ncbi:MarR family winged helix-turn-helix transcriptional regulator [Antribacter gilvus]|uniref:MarR family winged helix-turn-helix transcriptional regulator n=1 Tax=Antribacter gilvus TaxID=2304675 RepID=UPI001F0BDD57|nr:MarR family transcriptional regulator [Antribacter gilvus]